jgi:hypothetical protein
MANQMNHLPHINNMHAGFNHWDPVHNSIFDVTFTVPQALLGGGFSQEEVHLLQEQVTEVSGLEALQKTTAAGEQKFHGVTVSFLNPTLDTTAADITIKFNLNLKNVTDNYVLRLFKEWARLSYDLHNGTRALKANYVAESLTIAEANRDGTIWRAYAFHDVMVTAIAGLGTLNYVSNEAQSLDVTFRSDWWEEILATGADKSASAWVDQTNGRGPANIDTERQGMKGKATGTAHAAN